MEFANTVPCEGVNKIISDGEINLSEEKRNGQAQNATPPRRKKTSLRLRACEDPTPVNVTFDPKNQTLDLSGNIEGNTSIESSYEPQLSELDLHLAATYVEDSKTGRHSDFKISEEHLRLYHLYQNPYGKCILYGAILSHLLLALFEKPAVPGLELSYPVTMTLEFGFVCVYLVRLAHISTFTPITRFWSDTKHILVLILTGLTFLDMIIYIGLVESGNHGVRWSRALRPLFAVNFPEMRQIRRSFRNLRRTLPDVFNVLFLFFFSLAIFALMAFKLFGDKKFKWVDGRPYFATYWDSLFDLYVLVTTANNPDIMMPAFDQSPYYVIFFVIFLVVCYFIYMNIILAVIYNNYRKHLKNEVKKAVFSKRQQLGKAFDLLSISTDKRRVITRSRFVQLMRALNPQKNPLIYNVLWIVLDSDGSDVIDKGEFLKLSDLLNVEVTEVKDRSTLFEKKFPHIYKSDPSKYLIKIVKHKLFTLIFDLLTLANAIVIGVASSTDEWDDYAEWFFLAMFMSEIILKLYALGGRRFFRRLWNVFDFVVIGAALIIGLIEAVQDEAEQSRVTLDVLLVLRVLRLVKIIGNIGRFKVIVLTITKIIPSLVTYGGVILVFYYMFALVGMEAFQGKIRFSGYDVKGGSELYCGNALLNNTDFWREQYCNNNFNDLIHAFIVMFELTVVNQWQVIAYGYAAVTDPWARLYFISFHIICVIIVLNIFTAFVLEVFILEYSAKHWALETELEKKISEMGLSFRKQRRKSAPTISLEELVGSSDTESEGEDNTDGSDKNNELDVSDDTDVRFHISKRIRSVDVLLQKMFEKELELDDLGPDLDTIDDDDFAPPKLHRTAWHI